MLKKKLAVVDPALSNKYVIRRCVDSGVDVVVCCEERGSMPFDAQVEIRDFNGGDCDVSDACCVMESIPWGSSKTAFYNSLSVKNGGMLLLSVGITGAQHKELCDAVSDDVASRIAGVSFPSFHQSRPVLECVLYSENAGQYFSSVQSVFSSHLGILQQSSKAGRLFDRLGYLWAGIVLIEAYKACVDVEVADRIIAHENTGVGLGAFAVLDALGIDKFVEGLSLLVEEFASEDLLHKIYVKLPDIVRGMISDGFTGVSGRGGFYRTYDMRYGGMEQVIDLHSGLYRALKKDSRLQENLLDVEKCRSFSYAVWEQFLAYVGYLSQEQGVKLRELDDVLRIGYNWRYCVGELASRVGVKSFF